MRSFCSLFLVAVAATAALAAPAPRNGTDWPAVKALVGEIEVVVTDSGRQIAASAKAGTNDTAVSNAIISALNATQVKLAAVMDETNSAVDDQTLNVTQVESLSSSLKGELARFLGSISTQLTLLNPIQQDEINATKTACFDGINLRVDQAILLLNQTAPPANKTLVVAWNADNGTDWPAVKALVGEIEVVVTDSGRQIAASAKAGTNDTAVSNAIIGQLNATQVKLAAVMTETNAAVDAQTLNVTQVETLSSSLKGELARFLGSISGQLTLLNPIQQDEINATKTACFDGINLRVEQAILLLNQTAPPANKTLIVDWNAVQENVNQIISVLSTANDNIVGYLQDRTEIGAGTILEKLQMVRLNSAPVLNRLNNGARDQTLTKAQAEDEIGALQKLLGDFTGEIQQPLNTLPEVVADNVRLNVFGSRDSVGILAGDLKKLLAA